MNNTRVENWNGFEIHFTEVNGEWWAPANEIAKAMGYRDTEHLTRSMPAKYKGTLKTGTLGGTQEVTALTEKGLYRAIMRSNKPEAEAFQDWVYSVIQELRSSEDLKAYEAMQMLSKEHQKNSMSNLKAGMKVVSKLDYIKANTIADKAVSNEFGFKKMVKKSDMTPAMLAARQSVLDGVVDLMAVRDKLGLNMSVAQTVYAKANN